MSQQQQNEIDELKRKYADLERTVNLLCAAVGEIQVNSDPQHPGRKNLTLPEKRKSA